MRCRLRLEKFRESRVVHLAVDGCLESQGLETKMEELSGIPLRAGARLAPSLLASRSIELQVKGQVVGDREGRPLVEVGDEVRRDGCLAGVPSHPGSERLSLLVNPPGGRQAKKGNVVAVGSRRLKAADRGKVGEGEVGTSLRDRLVAEAGGTGNLKTRGRAGALDDGRTSRPQVCGERSGGLLGSGVGHEDRAVGALLGSRAELPEIVGQDVGQQLDAERTALLTFSLGLALNSNRLSIHNGFRATRCFCPPF